MSCYILLGNAGKTLDLKSSKVKQLALVLSEQLYQYSLNECNEQARLKKLNTSDSSKKLLMTYGV